MKDLMVELFKNNEFIQIFSATSLSDVFSFIAKTENIVYLADIKNTYFVFQKTKKGRYNAFSKKYTKVFSVNATGKEQSKFFFL